MKKFKHLPAIEEEEKPVSEVNPLLNSLHIDCELFKEEDNIRNTTIRVKKFKVKGVEEWRIFEDKTVVLVLNSSRFSNSEKEFLRTIDGFNYIISGYKNGWRSVAKFKQGIGA